MPLAIESMKIFSGEIMEAGKMTDAHGTQATVANRRNRSVMARINDRGPFAHGGVAISVPRRDDYAKPNSWGVTSDQIAAIAQSSDDPDPREIKLRSTFVAAGPVWTAQAKAESAYRDLSQLTGLFGDVPVFRLTCTGCFDIRGMVAASVCSIVLP
jgi:hypothetical protein